MGTENQGETPVRKIIMIEVSGIMGFPASPSSKAFPHVSNLACVQPCVRRMMSGVARHGRVARGTSYHCDMTPVGTVSAVRPQRSVCLIAPEVRCLTPPGEVLVDASSFGCLGYGDSVESMCYLRRMSLTETRHGQKCRE